MRFKYVAFFSVLCAVNLPIFPFVTSKRLGVFGLFFLALYKLSTVNKLRLKREGFEVVLFWLLFFLSSIVGVLISTEVNSSALAISLTFFIIILLKLILDNELDVDMDEFRDGLFLSTLILTVTFLYKVGVVINFELASVLSLRRYLLDSSIPINSTFNQIVFLVFFNIFIAFNLRYSKLIRGGMAIFGFILFIIIVFSLSRQNLIACLVMFFYIFYKLTNFRQKAFISFFLVIGIFSFAPSQVDGDSFSSLEDRVEKTTVQISSADYTRFNQFSDSFHAGLVSPFIGLGLGGFYEYARKLGYAENERVPEAAINQVMAEHGAVFFVLFILVLFYLFSKFKFSTTKIRGPCDSILLRGIFLSFITLLFFNEIHIQASIWIVFLLFNFIQPKNGV